MEMTEKQIAERAFEVYHFIAGLNNDDASAVMSIAQTLFHRRYMDFLNNKIAKS